MKQKPGRPRKFGRGRINATIRFTPQRYAKIKAAAQKHGRSISEQVEMMIEELALIRQTLTARRQADKLITNYLDARTNRESRVANSGGESGKFENS